MIASTEELTEHLLSRLRRVRECLAVEGEVSVDPSARFADWLDSMAMTEFLLVLAEDCGVTPAALEECAGRRFGTVAELAAAMRAAGIGPHERKAETVAVPRSTRPPGQPGPTGTCWLAGTAVQLPRKVQSAAEINALLRRPAGWLETHAGIEQRCVWGDEDPLAAAADAARACLDSAQTFPEEIGALLVTSEAPPQLAGLAAALHHRLNLRPQAVALEVGGACTGFLAAWWLAQGLLAQTGPVLVIAVEAPSRLLSLQPGPAGEAAALFGDAVAACLLGAQPMGEAAVPVHDVTLGCDGSVGHLLRVEPSPDGRVALHMDGPAVAHRAVRAMAQGVVELSRKHQIGVADLAAVVAHGGNGRMPALLARRLGLPPERVWSETPRTGNLGSASLPAAWAARAATPSGPVAWTTGGAGLTWAAAFTGMPPNRSGRSD